MTTPALPVGILGSSLGDEDELVNAIWYGEPGTGKTTGTAMLAKLGKVILVEAEGGAKRRALRDQGVPVGNLIPYRDITFRGLLQLHINLLTTFDDDPDAYVGVIFDSMTEIAATLLEAIIDQETLAAVQRGKPRRSNGAELGDYGIMTDQLRRLTRRFRDLPCHVAWTCLERRELDDDGTLALTPQLTPKFSADLRGFADIVVRTTVLPTADTPVEEHHPYGLFIGIPVQHGKTRGKDRFHVLPRMMVNPSADRIVQYVHGDLTEANDPLQEDLRTWTKTRTPTTEATA